MERKLSSKLQKPSWALPLLLSLAVVVPCFWRPMVSTVDLQSHLYNAWLAGLIRNGNVSGLWIGHQTTNILIDAVLPRLLALFGVSGAERIVTTTAVLIFFWGAFNFISAVQKKAVYWLAPWLAILSYGFIFQMGFLNFYISSGFVFWLFALFWRNNFDWKIVFAIPLLIAAFCAHPMPLLWFLGSAAYCYISRRLKFRSQCMLFLLSVAIMFLISSYIMHKYYYIWKVWYQLRYITGADQALLYGGWGYLITIVAILLFSMIGILSSENRWQLVSVPAQVYFLTVVATVLIPTSIRSSTQEAWAAYISERLSLFSAVLLFVILGRSVYRKWYLAAGLLTAAVFFVTLYGDVGKVARVEKTMQELVDTLPAGQRVISYYDGRVLDTQNVAAKFRELPSMLRLGIDFNFNTRLNTYHLLSRACIGHCFDYLNYEPCFGHFRIHANPGNPVVVSRWVDFLGMMDGTYVVKKSDLPLYVVLRCGSAPDDLCLQPLSEGRLSARLGSQIFK